ncbi:MAG: hypothetical protein Q7S96_03000 [bacterium]|nr:hypothetical protein [bacterium]
MRILKSSDKYCIAVVGVPGGERVVKIALGDGAQLRAEVARIRALGAYTSLRYRLPPILAAGVCTAGVFRGKESYVMPRLAGRTFSEHTQSVLTASDELAAAFRTVLAALLDIAAEHCPDPAYDGGTGRYFRTALRGELDAVRALEPFPYLLAADGVTLDGVRYAPLAVLVDRILTSNAVGALDTGPSDIASLGHWNFHGDNLVLEDLARAAAFRVIDPDVRMATADPLYGVARFAYTFPHDTADYQQYLIRSSLYTSGAPDFRITFLWPEVAYRHYVEQFAPFVAPTDDALVALDPRFADGRMRLRFRLSYLQCLLRGVSANYERAVEFVDGEATAFRHASTLLFLHALRFAAHTAAIVASQSEARREPASIRTASV